MTIEAMKQALEALETLNAGDTYKTHNAAVALRQAIVEAEKPWVKTYAGGKPNYTTPEKQEPVTVLPDGSAFGVMSFPLPKDHWLYQPRMYLEGEIEPIELPKPIMTHEMRGNVIAAVRYAIRGATNCGKYNDFDPDALVNNAVYALCGPYSAPVHAIDISAERVDETAKREHEWEELDVNEVIELIHEHITNLTPELTGELYGLVAAIDRRLQEKNHG